MTIFLNGGYATSYVADRDGETYIVETGNTAYFNGLGIDASGFNPRQSFIIKGTLTSVAGPVMLIGSADAGATRVSLKVDINGLLSANGDGVKVLSDGFSFENVGDVLTAGLALNIDGADANIVNSGHMSSGRYHLIDVSGGRATIINNGDINAAGSVITSTGWKTVVTNNLDMFSTRGNAIHLAGQRASLVNNGKIEAVYTAVELAGDMGSINNTKTISSKAGVGVLLSGDDNTVNNTTLISGRTIGVEITGADDAVYNHARIKGEAAAARLGGEDGRLDNSGIMSGAIGVIIDGSSNTLNNNHIINATGETGAAVEIVSRRTSTIVNNAEMHAESGTVIRGGEGREFVLNNNWLDGDVRLGGGNDRFDGNWGNVSGGVHGGDGDDLYIVDKAYRIIEQLGHGIDTVRTAYAYTLTANVEELELTGRFGVNATGNELDNRLTGNLGANAIAGLKGDDWLWGGKGDDRLSGGMGKDVFVFKANDGNDVIADFRIEEDRLSLHDFGKIDTAGEFLAAARRDGEDVVFDFGDLGSLRLVGVSFRALDVAHFDMT